MTDVVTKQPLKVQTSEVGPSLDLPYSQLEDVQRVLDARGIYYWVDEHVISIGGGPEMAVIEFGRRGDATAIQAALDEIH
jgi:hypothetical protein